MRKSPQLSFNNVILFTAKYKLHIMSTILSLLSLACSHYLITKYIPSNEWQVFFLSEIVLSLLLYYYTLKNFSRKNRRQLVPSLILSFFLSLIYTIGTELNSSNFINISPTLFVKLLFFFLVFLNLFICLLRVIYAINLKAKTFKIDRRLFTKTFLIFLAVGFLYYIILYPGIFSYDMAKQNTQFASGELTSHWSLLYGAIINFFIEVGNILFGSYSLGFSILMFIQMIFMCYVYTRITLFSAKNIRNSKFIPLFCAFFFLVPFFGVMMVTAAQDTFFGGLFALIIINLYEFLYEKKLSTKRVAILIMLSCLACTVRNNAVYCLLAVCITILFVKRKYIYNKRWLIFTLATPVIFYFIYSGPFFNLLNISKATGIQEIMSIPSQQLARAYSVNRSSFSDKDLQDLNKYYRINSGEVFSFEKAEQYPLLADYSKGSMNGDAVSNELIPYIYFWARIGIKNPKLYVEAFLLNSIGFWYPGKNYDDPRIHIGYQNYPGFSDTFGRQPGMKAIQRKYNESIIHRGLDSIIFNNGWQRIPIVAQLSSAGLYFIILFISAILLIIYKSWKHLIALLPILFLSFTLLLAPISIFRYAFPIGICMPIIVSATFIGLSNPKKPD